MAVLKKLMKKKRASGGRKIPSRALAQGTGKSTKKAFGSKNPGNGVVAIPRSLPEGAWDAFCHTHAALPRSVGPYTVIRTTTMITTDSPYVIFGTFASQNVASTASTALNGYGERCWTNVVAACYKEAGSVADMALPINSNSVTSFKTGPIPGSAGMGVNHSSALTCCPAAMSVQIMNPEVFSDARGQCAAAVCPTQLDLCGSTMSWNNLKDAAISYMGPRLLSGGKLVFRGIQMNSHPLSMSDCSDFRPIYNSGDIAGAQWENDPAGAPLHPEGWAPMVFINSYNAAVEPSQRKDMTFLVCQEWRVRFDIQNPAVASHVHHPVSSDIAWDRHIAKASAALPGVIDIVEKVAATGLNVAKMYGMAT